jgi:hypothetical protein
VEGDREGVRDGVGASKADMICKSVASRIEERTAGVATTRNCSGRRQ